MKNRLLRQFLLLSALFLCVTITKAQYNSPTVDGSIGGGEYGTHTNGQNQETSGSSVWYMTWDNTNLYIGITAANTSEGAVVYLDSDPQVPVNSGTNSNGTNIGYNYDGTSFAELQFRADLVVYFKNGYREYRTSDGSNGWSSATSAFGSYADAGGTDREVAIPWSAIGGRPASFNWFGYVTSSGGYVYAPAPTANATGTIGTSARYVRYYTVSSTTNGSSTKPFSQESYVFNSTSDITGFGAITVYDFTMNTNGRTLTRQTGAGGAWVINGTLVLNDGTVSFGSSSNNATCGAVKILGGTLTLSSASGGDIKVTGDFTKTAGTFTANSRQIEFSGSANQSFSCNGTQTLNYVLNSNTSGTVSINSSVTVSNTLTNNSSAKLTIASGTFTNSSTVTNNGTINISSGASWYANAAFTANTMNVSGTLRANAVNITGGAGLTFTSTGIYEHNHTAPVGNIPTATWNSGSTCAIIGYTSTAVTINNTYSQSFSNFTWNCTGQTATINLLGLLTTVNGNFYLQSTGTGSLTYNTNSPLTPTLTIGGNCTINANFNLNNGSSTPTFNVAGNFNHTGGTISKGGSGATLINFNGTASQTITIPTPSNFTGVVSFRLNNASGAVLSAGTTLPINNGATLYRSNGAFSGAGTISFNATASTVNYDGSTALTTTDYEWPASNAAKTQIVISGGAVISLHANRTLSNTANYLSITSGVLALGNYNLTLPAANTLSISSPSASTMIATNGTGNLIHTVSTSVPTTYLFPIGELSGTAEYSPVSLTMTTNSTSRLVGFRVVDAASVNINTPISASDYLSRTWYSYENGAGGTYTYNLALTYNNSVGDIVGTEGNLRVSAYDGSSWTPAPSTALSSPTITGSNFTNTSANLIGTEFTGRKQLSATYTWSGTTNTDWYESSNWTPTGVPTANDNVIINVSAPNICTIGSGSTTVSDFTLNGTGALNMAASTTLTIGGGITFGGSATASLDCSSTINMVSPGSITVPALNYGNLNISGGARTLPSGGTIGICGSYTAGSPMTVAGSTVDFKGTGTQTITASTYNNLTISNNRGGSTVTLASGTITVGGAFNPSLSNYTPAVSGNTIDFSSASAQSIPAFVYGSITNTGNGNRTWANSGIIEVRSSFTPGTGTHTITGSTFRYAATSGTVTLPAPFTTNVTNRQYNNLEFNGVGGTFVVNASTTHGVAGILTINNGTVNLCTSSATTWSIDGNFTISGGTLSLNSSAQASNFNLSGNFVQNGGTITRSLSGTTTLTFTIPGVAQTRTITQSSGTVSGNFGITVSGMAPILQLASGFNMGAGSVTMTIPSAMFLDCSTYVISGSGTVNVNNGGRIVTANADGISKAPSLTGSVQTNTRSFNTSALFYYNGTVAQVTGDGLPANLDRLYISNSAGVTLTTASINIASELNITSGQFLLGNNIVTLASAATVTGTFSASNMVVTNGTGELRKSFTGSASFTWPIGDNTGTAEYSPISLNLTTGVNGYIGMRVVNAVEPNNGSATNYIKRYWVASTNLSSYSWTGTATYTTADKVGTESSYRLNIFDPNAPSTGWTQYNSSSASSNVLTISSGPGTGTLNNTSITAREDVTLYYQSNGSGAWNVPSNWQVADNPAFTGATTATVAPNNANSYGIWIRNGHTITVGSVVWADDLQVDAGGTLTVGVAGNFTLANGTAATDLTNNGTLNFNNTSTIQSGASVINNALINASVSPSAIGSTITHSSAAIYNHAEDGGTIPASTWNTGSLLKVTGLNGSSSIGGFDQTFSNIEFNSPSQNTASLQIQGKIVAINGDLTMTASGTREVRLFAHSGNTNTSLTIGGNLKITGGRLSLCNATSNGSQAVVLNVSGDILISGGTLDLTGASANTSGAITLNASGNVSITGTGIIAKTQNGNNATFRFNKATGTQTFSASAPTTAVSTDPIKWEAGDGTTQPELILSSNFIENATATFTVRTNATLNCGTYILQGTTAGTTGTFTLQNAATLKMGAVDGISTAPNTTGNIQTGPAAANRVFNIGSYYEYNGTSNQITGLGLPTNVARLTINNSGSASNNFVTLSQSTTISSNGQLNLSNGYFKIGNAGLMVILAGNNTVNGIGGDFAPGNEGGIVRATTNNSSATGTLNFWEMRTSTGFNFGTNSSIHGLFLINAGGYVDANPPYYIAGSTLQYNTGGNYGRWLEWSSTSGAGYPHHVQITSTVLNLGNAGTNTARICGGDLIIDGTSTLTMNEAGSEMTASLTVNGNVTFVSTNSSSTLTLSSQIGGDIYVKGNWNRNGGTFNSNNRMVSFNGTSPQSINGPANTTFDYLRIDNTSGVSLNNASIIVAQQLDMQNGHLTLGANNASLNAFASIVNANSSKYVITDGNGLLIQNLGGSNTLYPVGPNSTQYAPATLAQYGTVDNIGVRVKTAPPFDNAVNDDLQMVNYQWYISEGVNGGNSLFTKFQWSGSDEASNFNRNNPVYHGDWTGAVYNIRPTSATAGSNPYTSSSATNYTGILNRVFVVGNLHGIKGCISTVSNGDWNTAATWESGVIPPHNSNVCINHNVTVNVVDPDTVTGVTIGVTGNLTVSSGRTIAISNAGFIDNSKVGLILGSGKVVFVGTAAINGSEAVTFNDVEINNGLTINKTPTIKGVFRIKAGGYLISNSVDYAVLSTLEYATGGTYGRNLEWSATSGIGYPHHVLVTGNTTLNLGNGGAGTARQIGGSLTINSGSELTMAGSPVMTAALTVKGNLFINGTLTLSTSAGGDLKLDGNWERDGATGVFNSNNRAVFFTGAANQHIRVLGSGTESIPYVIIDKPNAGTYVKMHKTAPDETDLRITGTSGGVLQLNNNGGLDLDGRTVGIDYNSNTGSPSVWIEVNAPREIINSSGINQGEFKFYSSANPNQPTWFTSGVKDVSGTGTLTFNSDVLMTIADGSCDFGVSAGNPVTFIKGVLQVKLGGSVGQTMHPCFYETGSTLRFANTVDYLVPSTDKTWATGAINSGLPGIPYNVEVLDAGTDLTLNDARSLKNDLTITNGTFTINPGAGSEFSLGGNWTRTGASSAFTNNAGARVVFRGSAPQAILCTANGNTETFKELEIDNSGGVNNNAITLSGTTRIVVTDTIAFTKGIITTGANRVETNATTSYVASAGNTNYTQSWVNGNLRRNINNTNTVIEFPVGIATRGNLATIYSNSLAGVSYYDVNFHTVGGGNDSEMDAWETSIPGNPYHTKYVAMNSGGFWTIEPNTQPASGTYDIRLYFNGMLAGMADNQFGVLKRSNGSLTYADFKPFPGTSISNAGGTGRLLSDGFALRMGYTSFSEFGIGLSGVPLPVQLTTFIGHKDGRVNKLNWKTSSELNTLEFDVERSTDGVTFKSIGTVAAAVFSTTPLNYSYTDYTPANTINYYRLKMVDVDYSYEYSNIIAINNVDHTTSTMVVLYPNPTVGNVFADITSSQKQDITYTVFDLSGRILMLNRVTLEEGKNSIDMNIQNFAAGNYLVEFRDDTNTIICTQKFIKKN